jgi:hypothetical protein
VDKILAATVLGTVRQLTLAGIDCWSASFWTGLGSRLPKLDQLEFEQNNPPTCAAVLASTLLCQQLKTLVLQDISPYSFNAPYFPALRTLHVNFPKVPIHAERLTAALLQSRLTHVEFTGDRATNKLANHSEHCMRNLGQLVPRLDVFRCTGLWLGARLFRLLAGCTASAWTLCSMTQGRFVASLIRANPGVRHMELHFCSDAAVCDDLAHALAESESRTFKFVFPDRPSGAR